MAEAPKVGWAILGTANIARAAFVPALGRTGGEVLAIGSREPARGRAFADQVAPEARVGSYAEVLSDARVAAVYVPLPNHLHREWAIRALEAGKAVLCEKPLATSVADVEAILAAVDRTRGLLWEAFVFMFQPQMVRLQLLLDQWEVGDLTQVVGSFHFRVGRPENIRWSAEAGGGALNDVGCYPIRLARQLFRAEPVAARAMERRGDHRVDVETQAMLAFPEGGRLLLTCGLARAYDTETNILGTEGRLRVSNPYHPAAADVLEVHHGSTVTVERLTGDEPSFTHALGHIHTVIAGDAAPAHLARDEALGTARALEMVRSRSERCE